MKISKLFRWQRGRQDSGYDKMFLGGAYWPLKFDMYLLRFPCGSEIPLHVDEVKNGNHYRINFILKHAVEGGDFICDNPIFESSRVKFFRPDKSRHAVSKVKFGSRYVFSIGWVLEPKKPEKN